MDNQIIILIAIAVFVYLYNFNPRVLCNINFHRWTKDRLFNHFNSGVRDYSRHCKLCGIKQRWSVAREKDWDDE